MFHFEELGISPSNISAICKRKKIFLCKNNINEGDPFKTLHYNYESYKQLLKYIKSMLYMYEPSVSSIDIVFIITSHEKKGEPKGRCNPIENGSILYNHQD